MKTLDLSMLAIVLTVAVYVLFQFIISKDGYLRKVMIGYFAVEVFIYLTIAFYIITEAHLKQLEFLIFIILLPKAIVKIFLLRYFNKK